MKIKKKIAGFLNKIIRKGHWYCDIEFPDCQKFWNYKTFNTDVVNLGSTSALHAFNYEGINLKCANFALRHNPILADFAILKNYHSFIKPNGTVIIALCPFTSLSGNYDYLGDRYYTLLLPTTMPSFSYVRQQFVKDKKQRPLLYYPIIEFFNDIKFALFGNKSTLRSEQWLENNSKYWMDSWMKEFSVDNFDAPLSLLNKDSIQCATSIINDMISFCIEREFTPVLVIPPMHHSLSNKFTPKIRKILFDFMLDGIKNGNVKFLNYMDDERFSNDNSLFQDAFFLNEKGAKLFTNKLLFDLGLTQ